MNETRAARYQRLRRRTRSLGVLCGGVLLGIMALTPAGAATAAWAAAVTSDVPGPLAPMSALVLFVGVLVVLWEAALVSAVIAARLGTPSRTRPEPAGDAGRAAAGTALVALPCAIAAAMCVRVAVWAAGDAWWLVAGALVAAALVLALHAAPGLLARLSGARPVVRPALVERLGALSRQIRVPIESIDELPATGGTPTTALVAGAGASRRVFISSELIRDWSDDEIAVVVAHEFAHHAHHDLWRTLALDAAVLAAAFWTAGRLPSALPWLSLPQLGELAALPFVALIVSGVWLAATPVRHALSRAQERRADAFALRVTGGADAFRAALRRLASRHLVEERPSRLTQWLFHRHPSVAERLAVADAFQPESKAR
jgi:STE24 endopeptidase